MFLPSFTVARLYVGTARPAAAQRGTEEDTLEFNPK